MKRWVAPAVAIALVAACSSATSVVSPPSDDIAVPVDAPFDQTLSSDAPIDTGPEYNGGGPFVCGACTCDGTLDMCVAGGGGGAPVLDGAPDDDAPDDAPDDSNGSDADDGDADAAAACVVPDASVNGCVEIPLTCFPQPTCACILSTSAFEGCACKVDSSGDGFIVTCIPKP